MGTAIRIRWQLRRFASSNSSSWLLSASKKVKDMVSNELFEQTLRFYKEQLHSRGLYSNNNSILPSVVKASSSANFLHFGLQLHCIALKSGSNSDSVTANSFLAMYGKCSHVESARLVFDEVPVRDAVTWNSMITCYVRNGYCLEVLKTFKLMQLSGFESKPEVIAAVLPVCSATGLWKSGREIHGSIVRKNGRIDTSIFLSTALVDMYSRCFELHHVALRVFNLMKEKNEVSWTTMIAGCIRNKCYSISLEYIRAMQMEGLKPNRVTLIEVLPACSELGVLKHGKQIHGYAIRCGFDSESHLAAALMDMYCKCSAGMASAHIMFERFEGKDVVIWSTMIRGYSLSGDSNAHAMELFNGMQLGGIKPNSVTLLAVITSCTALASMKHGQGIHGFAVKSGLSLHVNVGNALIDMYAKCGCLQFSHQVFKEMPMKDSVSWSSLIQCYGLHGHGAEALQLFHEMQKRQIQLDATTFLVVLSACKHAGLVKVGQELFNGVTQVEKIALTVEHYGCYIDLLARSGKVEEACEAVSGMPMKPSPNIWSCLVSACKTHGRLDLAEKLVQQLIDSESDNSANYTLLCQVYTEIGDWHGAEEVRRAMRLKGLTKSCGYSRVESDHRATMQACM